MNHSEWLAARIREVYLDGKWIANTNFKEQVENLGWQDATTGVLQSNSIALLVFHLNYYLSGLLNVLKGGRLEISDKFSFDIPEIETETEWQNLVNEFLENARQFAEKVAELPAEKLNGPFVEEKYGTYLRNIEGVVEHSYYHLGQVVLIKKLVTENRDKLNSLS